MLAVFAAVGKRFFGYKAGDDAARLILKEARERFGPPTPGRRDQGYNRVIEDAILEHFEEIPRRCGEHRIHAAGDWLAGFDDAEIERIYIFAEALKQMRDQPLGPLPPFARRDHDSDSTKDTQRSRASSADRRVYREPKPRRKGRE